MSDEPEPGTAGWPPWVERWVLPFVQESALWPVLFALLGHVAAGIAPVLVMAVRDHNPLAIAALGGLVVVSAGPVQVELSATRRPGGVTLVVVLTWLAGAGLAWLAGATGLL